MTKRKIYIALAAVFLFGAMLVFCGFVTGEYISNQKMEKRAIAYLCGTIDPQTLKFNWSIQQSAGIIVDAPPRPQHKPLVHK